MSYTKTLDEQTTGHRDPQAEDSKIDAARLFGAIINGAEDVGHPEHCYYEPNNAERMMALVDQVKMIAEDWDDLTTIELLKLMAQMKVVFAVDDKPWVKGEAA